MLVKLSLVALATLVLNLPCGFWRGGTRRLSLAWFAAVHAPVPAVVALRLLAGIGWQLDTLPALLAAYCLGQYLGGRLRGRREAQVARGGQPASGEP